MFSSTYTEARNKFIELSDRAKFKLRTYTMSQTGPNHELLSTDLAYFFANENIKELLIISSGVHGIEGYVGSAAQAQLLSQITDDNLAMFANKGLGIVLIHAANPHGFAYGQRVDRSEIKDGKTQNVDPNRNFLDFTKPLPSNPGYQNLENVIIPQNWSWWSHITTTTNLLAHFAFDQISGSYNHFSIPVLSGQYTNPEGFSFGGTSASWTNIVIQQIMRDLAIESFTNLEKVVFIDLHAGIGKKGTCEVYPSQANGCFERVKAALGDIKGIAVCNAPYPASGTLDDAMVARFAGKEVTSFTLEFGTASPVTVLNSLRAQACLNRYGNDAGQAETISKELRLAFYPENDPEWKQKVLGLSNSMLTKIFTDVLGIKFQRNLPTLSGQKSIMFQPQESDTQMERIDAVKRDTSRAAPV